MFRSHVVEGVGGPVGAAARPLASREAGAFGRRPSHPRSSPRAWHAGMAGIAAAVPVMLAERAGRL